VQKDVEANWTKKHGKNHFGYKLHASVDKRCKLIRRTTVTHAAVTDTGVFEELLDSGNTSRDVYADRGYPASNGKQGRSKPVGVCTSSDEAMQPKTFPRRRNGATTRSPRYEPVSSMCLAPWPRWVGNWCAALALCARPSSCS
jgi:hypothetical protein